jgi:hypothetical protein
MGSSGHGITERDHILGFIVISRDTRESNVTIIHSGAIE